MVDWGAFWTWEIGAAVFAGLVIGFPFVAVAYARKGMHRRGCHCQVCRDFVNAYQKEYKRRTRAAAKAQ